MLPPPELLVLPPLELPVLPDELDAPPLLPVPPELLVEPPPPELLVELPLAGSSSPQPIASAVDATTSRADAPASTFFPRVTVRTLRFIGTALAYGCANCKSRAFALVRRWLPATLKAAACSCADSRVA